MAEKTLKRHEAPQRDRRAHGGAAAAQTSQDESQKVRNYNKRQIKSVRPPLSLIITRTSSKNIRGLEVSVCFLQEFGFTSFLGLNLIRADMGPLASHHPFVLPFILSSRLLSQFLLYPVCCFLSAGRGDSSPAGLSLMSKTRKHSCPSAVCLNHRPYRDLNRRPPPLHAA